MDDNLTPTTDWRVEERERGLGDDMGYFGGDHYSSEIFGLLPSGERAQVAYIPLVLTADDHRRLRVLEREDRKRKDAYFKKHLGGLHSIKAWLHPLRKMSGSDQREWEATFVDTEAVYRERGSKEYHDAHRQLVLAAPLMRQALQFYVETGQIPKSALDRALAIADGHETPSIKVGEYAWERGDSWSPGPREEGGWQ